MSFLVHIVKAQLFSSSLDPQFIHKQGQFRPSLILQSGKYLPWFPVAEAAGNLLINPGNGYFCMLAKLRMVVNSEGVNAFIFPEKE